MSSPSLHIFPKATLVDGRPAELECVAIAGQTFSIARGALTVLRLEDEGFHEVQDPAMVVESVTRERALGVDLFTFCQRLPHTEPRFPYHHELESFAAIEIQTYDYWWTRQIEKATRNQIRKGQKLGLEVRQCEYDDAFVAGMTAIFNETPIRQGRPFWHYGKDFETVKEQFSRYLFREALFGAYHRDELVGFAMVGKGPGFADLGQVIARLAHRDKATTSALIGKAVEFCESIGFRHLVYAYWSEDSLGDFKRRNGFREVRLPRYYVPLTIKGQLALRAGAHRGLKHLLPSSLAASLKQARRRWYQWQESRGESR
jgi:hypothetical protein